MIKAEWAPQCQRSKPGDFADLLLWATFIDNDLLPHTESKSILHWKEKIARSNWCRQGGNGRCLLLMSPRASFVPIWRSGRRPGTRQSRERASKIWMGTKLERRPARGEKGRRR